jgi:hypothetical protein
MTIFWQRGRGLGAIREGQRPACKRAPVAGPLSTTLEERDRERR